MAKKTKKKKRSRKGLKRWKQLKFGGKVWRVAWVGFLCVWGFTILQVLFCAVFYPPLTPLMIHRFFEQVKDENREVNFERDYVRLDEISANLVNAVVVSEDGLYMYHHGFDIKQMKMAYIEGKKGRRERGGSTISQQCAKNCFLPHHHSMLRKAAEAYYTIMIEAVWGKKRIMECYLNIIEFGDGIYGCEAASQHYFGHSASHLTKREAALLAVCLPTPLKSNPGRPSGYLSRQASVVQGRMAMYGRINLDAKREDLNPMYVAMMEEENIWDFAVWMLTDGESLHPKHAKGSKAATTAKPRRKSEPKAAAPVDEPEEVMDEPFYEEPEIVPAENDAPEEP